MTAHSRILAAFLATFCASTALAQDPNSPDSDEAAALAFESVVGGKESAPCGWPSTVDISGCTGTLIHHRVVTTAAHCLYGSSARVTFTAGKNMPGSFTVNATCKSGARGSSGGSTGRDWGYCVLPDDPRIKMMQITPPLVGCEADRYLKPGNNAWVVGFGTTGSGRNDNGIKREVEVKINKVGNGIVDIGDKDVGACHGDSGGPLYMKITDGTHDWGWRVAGSTSGAGGPCDCACSTVFVDIRQHVKAIEENEDIDVTPCTDADGNWDPGPDCKDFITDPASGTGTYPMCTAPTTKEPIASCGEPAATAPSGAAGAAGGAAGSGAAGSGAAGQPAVAAGSGGSAALGGAGMSAAAGASGAEAAVPSPAGTGGSAGVSAMAAAAGRVSPPGFGVGAAGATAGAARPTSAGALGTSTSAVLAAGSTAPPFVETAAPQDSGGCQAVNISGAGDTRMTWLFALALIALAARSVRSRQRH